MHRISVERECGCFRKSDLQNDLMIENKDDALIQAITMTNKMNDEFCGKHEFQVVEQANHFLISLKQEPQSHSSGCCGGGCGHH